MEHDEEKATNSSDEEPKSKKPRAGRRTFLGVTTGVVATAAVGYWQRNPLTRWMLTLADNDVPTSSAPAAGSDVCVLTPDQIEGPYYVQAPKRSAIREDREGVPLSLEFEIVQLPDCTPVDGAAVEIWHCDAQGRYSGYSGQNARAAFDTIVETQGGDAHLDPVDEETFLRGTQISGNDGRVRFETIFPGWYEPRVTHIHLKVSHDGRSFLTTQLYFTDDLVEEIYTTHPDYVDYGTCPYDLTNDAVLGQLSDGTGLILKATGDPLSQLQASARFGIG